MPSLNTTIPVGNSSLKTTTPSKETIEAMLEVENISEDSDSKKYDTVEELFKALNSDI